MYCVEKYKAIKLAMHLDSVFDWNSLCFCMLLDIMNDLCVFFIAEEDCWVILGES